MKIVPLNNVNPNQSFSFTEDNDYYAIELRTIGKATFATIARNGQTIISSKRCPPNGYLFLKYQEAGRGNFVFFNAQENYPYYQDFGKDTKLVYMSPSEMLKVRS